MLEAICVGEGIQIVLEEDGETEQTTGNQVANQFYIPWWDINTSNEDKDRSFVTVHSETFSSSCKICLVLRSKTKEAETMTRNRQFYSLLVAALLIILCSELASAQESSREKQPNGVPVSTQWLLDASNPSQRAAIKSVYLLVCPKTQKKGTAFLLKSGTMVTDNHVVEGCESGDLWAESPTGTKITFSKLVTDPNRDLALLRPTTPLDGGLVLGSPATLKVGINVNTWGFPLIYNGPAPLLSVGYVAGYHDVQIGTAVVKHIVVNGAFNPGNSGGPLLVGPDNQVVGIVVWRMRILPDWVQTLISGFGNPGASVCCVATEAMPDGTKRGISSEEASGLILQQFYDTVQVMIGEATSVSELKAFLDEKEASLRQ